MLQRLEELWGALTLFGPSPPEAEGDEGDDDEDKGSQDNSDYEVGEVTGSRHQSVGELQPGIWSLWWSGPLVMRTSWGGKKWKKLLTKQLRLSRSVDTLTVTLLHDSSKVAIFPLKQPHLLFQGSPRCQIRSLLSRWSSASWCRRRSQAAGQWLNASICLPPPHPSYSHCHYRCLLAGSRCRNHRWACCLRECTVEREINHVTFTVNFKQASKKFYLSWLILDSSGNSPSIWE